VTAAAAAVYMTLLKMRKERPIGLSFEREMFLRRATRATFSSLMNTAWIFQYLYFQLLYLPEETCFQQVRSSAVKGSIQAVLGSSDRQKVLAAGHYYF